MKILYIDQYFSNRTGISGTRSYEFARRMTAQGHRVTMLTSSSRYSHLSSQKRWISRREIDGIDVISVRIRYSHMMGFFRRFLSFVSFMLTATMIGLFLSRHDVVFATSTPLSVGFPALVVSRLRRTPFVFEVRDLWPRAPIELGIIRNRLAIALFERFERLLYRQADAIVSLSPGMTEEIVFMGGDPEKIHLVPNACDLDLFGALPSRKALRKSIGLGEEFIAIYAGTVGMANGLNYIVDVARELEERGAAGIRFLIIGEGNDKNRVQWYARDRKAESVAFLGAISREEVARYIAAADLGLTIFANYPFAATTSPNKFFDYLAAGLPCAINVDGWVAREIDQAQAGIFLPPGNPKLAAGRIRALMQEPDLCARMGANAKSLAETRFERGLLFSRLMTALESAASPDTAGQVDVEKNRSSLFQPRK